jgi:sugar lactone lactonase YvrE
MVTTWLTARPVVPDLRLRHGEGCVWDGRRGRFLFVDIEDNAVLSWDPGTEDVTAVRFDRAVTDVHPTDTDALLVATREGVALARGGELEGLCAPLAGRPDIRMNDGNVDPAGRYLVGSMAYDISHEAGALYRVVSGDPVATSVAMANVTISNGIDWSSDGSLLFYVDSPTRVVDRYSYDVETGELGDRRVFTRIDGSLGLPDGLTVDSQDGVWVALFGGGRVHRYTPEGDLDVVVHVRGASQVTSCCFGGEDMGLLLITTSHEGLTPDALHEQPDAGRLHIARTAWTGRPSTPFPTGSLPPRPSHLP